MCLCALLKLMWVVICSMRAHVKLKMHALKTSFFQGSAASFSRSFESLKRVSVFIFALNHHAEVHRRRRNSACLDKLPRFYVYQIWSFETGNNLLTEKFIHPCSASAPFQGSPFYAQKPINQTLSYRPRVKFNLETSIFRTWNFLLAHDHVCTWKKLYRNRGMKRRSKSIKLSIIRELLWLFLSRRVNCIRTQIGLMLGTRKKWFRLGLVIHHAAPCWHDWA